DGRVVLVALSNHVLAALRAKRGDLLWWKPLSGRAAFPPTLSKDLVFAASRSAVFQAFDLGDGTATTAFIVASAEHSESREILAPAALIGPNVFLATGGEAEGEALVLVLDLVPPKPPDKVKPQIKR
ncbi:MAG: PQQ-binding-like beta-propeller repeat protein, partial [Candidatus Aminicenantes bacterium]|nr:PQQ-binding-like beta-propeller repeat protein [Candidatus Aminicenantes bacterium]